MNAWWRVVVRLGMVAPLLAIVGCATARPPATSATALPATGAPVALAQATGSTAASRLPAVPLDRGDAGRGEALFQRVGCLGCHTVRGTGGTIGPDLSAVALRAPERAAARGLGRPELYFVESIVEPQAYVVEGYAPVMLDWRQMNLTEQDLADLAAFLATLTGP